ncbi:uncharacterized protein LOC110441319 [Mizuhopecten yessoensis]|uniref:G-protein coupled receptors family 1 profile domain-containing protein n=1 Tax=Mizuhopecten yessoensis TaxID=6573 RepID=A0A210PJM2_MIZYE|nr:uncharacterized protein LOC110441319 [Mizuhopecten yessoensis]OWF36679.1 hypothetical protein KP79_PYT03008 [Mizuhopecten yessoensis]
MSMSEVSIEDIERLYTFQKWAVPVVVAFGLPLNMLSFYLFWRTKLRKASSSRYMAAIAMADSGYLFSKMLTHLPVFDVPVYHIHGSCQIIMYINHVSTFLAIWFLAALVIEKSIGLYWPRKKSNFCTVFRAKCVIAALTVMSIVCYHYITWTIGPSADKLYCSPWPDNNLLQPFEKLARMDAFLVAVIPHATIFVLSCLISIKACIYYSRSKSPEQEQFVRRQRTCLPQEKEFRTTPSLLCVAFTTVLLDVPNCIIRVFFIMHPIYNPVASFLQFVTYSIKTELYFISSSQYRLEVWRLIARIARFCKIIEPQNDTQTVSQQTDNGGEIIVEGKV